MSDPTLQMHLVPQPLEHGFTPSHAGCASAFALMYVVMLVANMILPASIAAVMAVSVSRLLSCFIRSSPFQHSRQRLLLADARTNLLPGRKLAPAFRSTLAFVLTRQPYTRRTVVEGLRRGPFQESKRYQRLQHHDKRQQRAADHKKLARSNSNARHVRKSHAIAPFR